MPTSGFLASGITFLSDHVAKQLGGLGIAVTIGQNDSQLLQRVTLATGEAEFVTRGRGVLASQSRATIYC